MKIDWEIQKRVRDNIDISSSFLYDNETISYRITTDNGVFFNNENLDKSHRTFYINNHNEKKIFSQYWLQDVTKPTIIFFHGNAENSSSHPKYFYHLLQKGFNLLSFDQEGYGSSDGIRGYLNDFNDYMKNIDIVISHYNKQIQFLKKGATKLKSKSSNATQEPEYIFTGFSMGGFLLLNYLLNYDSEIKDKIEINISKIILLAPWLNNHPRIVSKIQTRFLLIFRKLFNKETIERQDSQKLVLDNNCDFYINMYKNLTDNKEFLRNRFLDKRIHRLVSKYWLSSITYNQQKLFKIIKNIIKEKMDKKEYLSQKLYVFVNENDKIVDNERSLFIINMINSNHLIFQQKCYHDFLDYNDERWDYFRLNFDRILFDKYSH